MAAKDWTGRLSAALLDDSLPTPLYHQIHLVLRERIRSGEIAEGVLLPGEQELGRLFDVSRITVKRALNELAAAGLVSRHRGRGTVVAGSAAIPVVKGSFDTLIESLQLMGLKTELKLLEFEEEVPAAANVARHLEIETGAPVQRAVRLRSLEGEPFSYLVTFVPAHIGRRYTSHDLATTPILTLLARAGATVFEAEQWITAVGAEPTVAAALGVPAAAPLLKIERVMRASENRPVQLIYAHYRPDRFQYHVHDRRKRRGAGPETSWRDES